jgi:hypothetical protein
VDENLEPSIDGSRINDRSVSDYDPRVLKIADATQTRGRSQPDALGQLSVRQPTINLEFGQNCAIEPIHST